MTTNARDVIVHVPGVVGGEPVVRGTRVSVADIVARHRHYRPISKTASSFSNISPAAVQAALAYYEDHHDEIEAIFALDDAFEEEEMRECGSLSPVP